MKRSPFSGTWGSGKARLWAEQLKAQGPGAEVPLTCGESNGWLDGQPAVNHTKMRKRLRSPTLCAACFMMAQQRPRGEGMLLAK
jgi:hypothetical protein